MGVLIKDSHILFISIENWAQDLKKKTPLPIASQCKSLVDVT